MNDITPNPETRTRDAQGFPENKHAVRECALDA